jgi:hypothetical protein
VASLPVDPGESFVTEYRTEIPGKAGPAFREFTSRRPVTSLLAITRYVLLSPRRFFDWLPPDGALRPPVLYFSICWLVGSLLEVLSTAPFLEEPASLAVLIFLLALLPILLFVFVPLQHTLLFFLAEDEQHGMGTTLRISCYAAGAIALIAWIPLVDLLVVPHLAYVLIYGLKKGHGVPVARALLPSLLLAGLFCIPVASGIIFEYRAVQEVTQEPPLSYAYFPPPERSADLPPGVTGVVALLDSSENQEKVAKLRDASYADKAPSYAGGAMVGILTADQEGQPKGVSGYAHGSPGGSASEETLRVDAEHPGKEIQGTYYISYDAEEHRVTTPGDSHTKPSHMLEFHQFFNFGPGSYTLNLRQVGKEPKKIAVTTYSGPVSATGQATFHVPYRVARPENRLRLKIRPGLPLDELRLEIDRDGDGTYEESWMPEVTVVGKRVHDWEPPVTTAHVKEVPSAGERLMLYLEAKDYSDSEKVPPSGVGITYYWINDSGPRIYMKPVPVEPGDDISYWSMDLNGNLEWRREGGVSVKPLPD